MKFIKKQALIESVQEKVEEEKEFVDAPKEEQNEPEQLQESVSKERGYTRSGIEKAVQEVFKDIDEETYTQLESDIYNYYGPVHTKGDELTAEEVDELIDQLVNKYEISPEQRDLLEDYIVADFLSDPVRERREDFESDVRDLKEFIDEARENPNYYHGLITVSSKKFFNELQMFLNHLQELNYTGEEE